MKTYLKRKTAFLISPRELVYKLPGTPGGQPSGQESVEAAKLRPGGHTDNAEEMGQILTIGVSGTNKELESKLAAERTRFPEGNPYPIDEEFTSEKARPLASKIGAVVALGHQISIGQDGADVTFDFVHNGESINLTYQEGEGVYLAITVGEKRYGIDPYFLTLDDNVALDPDVIGPVLDKVADGLRAVMAATPVYRKLQDHPDVVSNDGVNVRDDNGRVSAKAPRGTYFQVIGAPKDGYIHVYYTDSRGEVVFGKVSEGFLGDPMSSFDSSKDAAIEKTVIGRMKVTETASGSGGLSLRDAPGTYGNRKLRIPVGTVVEVVGKSSAAGGQQWAEVQYVDASGTQQAGWACIYQHNSRYLDSVE